MRYERRAKEFGEQIYRALRLPVNGTTREVLIGCFASRYQTLAQNGLSHTEIHDMAKRATREVFKMRRDCPSIKAFSKVALWRFLFGEYERIAESETLHQEGLR